MEFAGSTANLVAGPKEDAGPPLTENPVMAEPKGRRTGDLAAVPPEAVIDGDTFLLQGKKIRLYGIDRDRQAADFATGKRVRAFSSIEKAARLKLDRLEAAATLHDLAALPGNRFEALSGDRRGQYSIRINDRWRVCFEWPKGSPGPENVEIVDYHQENRYGHSADPSRRTSRRGTGSARNERSCPGPPA